MNKKKLFFYGVLPVSVLTLVVAGIASAHGLFGGFGLGGFGLGTSKLTPDQIATNLQTRLQNEATILGVSVDVVKQAWLDGKSIQQIIKDNNLDTTQIQQRIKDQQLAKVKSVLQALVTNGTLTQAQADAKLQTITNQLNSAPAGKGMGRMHGFGGRGMMGLF